MVLVGEQPWWREDEVGSRSSGCFVSSNWARSCLWLAAAAVYRCDVLDRVSAKVGCWWARRWGRR